MTTTPLRELALLFLKLGVTSFGGPAAHVAMMEDEVVRRRQWLTRPEFLDLVSATNLIPGPNSTELAIHIGHRRAGWPGLLVAGACFILPAAVIVTAVASVYVRAGSLPEVSGILYGVKPVVIAVILQALWRLGTTALTSPLLAGTAMLAVTAVLLGVHEIVVLALAGALVAVIRYGKPSARMASLALPLWPLFLFFAKVGSVLFGSGYVLLAFLRSGLVADRGWLTESQLLDAVAVGQITPGPVFTTATFVGYLLAGAPGAVVATVGIFLPAFIFVAISGPLVPRIRRSPTAGAVLDGVNAASLALMAVVTWQLGVAALVDWVSICLAMLSLVALIRWRTNSAWLVLGGVAIGLLLPIVRGRTFP